MQHSKTPAGMCDYSWRGLRCERLICSFAHHQGAGTVAQQQQQPQALPPPPPPPPPPQQQTQPAARQQGKGGQEGVEQKVRGRTTCSLAGTTCQLAGAVGHGGTAAITDSTDSAVRQGRPRRGQGREKRGVSSQTPRDPWDFVMHTVPGSVSPTLFHGDNQLSRG